MPGGAGKKTDGFGGGLSAPEPYSLWRPPNGLVIAGRVYPIRTDFRTAVRYEMAAMEGRLTAEDFCRLWFPAETPEDLEAAQEAVGLFYRMGQRGDGAEGPIPYGFSQDAGPIFAAFRRHYGIDLSRERLHWWHFRALLEGLLTHSFRQRVAYRTADLGGLDPEERAEALRFRAEYAIGGERETLEEHLDRLRRLSGQEKEEGG